MIVVRSLQLRAAIEERKPRVYTAQITNFMIRTQLLQLGGGDCMGNRPAEVSSHTALTPHHSHDTAFLTHGKGQSHHQRFTCQIEPH